MPAAPFTPGLFRFLTELAVHNERPWFEKNKARYEAEVREPMLDLISDLGPGLRKISPHFDVDPRPVGGSMMRIYRDVRFSKDKSPYKTAITAHFQHRDGTEGATPGFYLHLQPRRSLAAGGIWRPGPGALGRIRQAIAAEPKLWKAATSRRVLGPGYAWHGEGLKRPPKGFAEDHPCIEDLKRKDFALGFELTDEQVTSSSALDTILEQYRRAAPMTRFLCGALGLTF